jgi:hypothetical protein
MDPEELALDGNQPNKAAEQDDQSMGSNCSMVQMVRDSDAVELVQPLTAHGLLDKAAGCQTDSLRSSINSEHGLNMDCTWMGPRSLRKSTDSLAVFRHRHFLPVAGSAQGTAAPAYQFIFRITRASP